MDTAAKSARPGLRLSPSGRFCSRILYPLAGGKQALTQEAFGGELRAIDPLVYDGGFVWCRSSES